MGPDGWEGVGGLDGHYDGHTASELGGCGTGSELEVFGLYLTA